MSYFISLFGKFQATMAMFEYESSDNAMSKDALFLERLDTFMDKCLTDIKAFAERELRPYQEVFKDLQLVIFRVLTMFFIDEKVYRAMAR